MNREIPVYLFTGFLGSGKTTFIQDILCEDEFNAGQKTLLLLCEEGEEEYDPSKFAFPHVAIETVDDEKELTRELLTSLSKKHNIERAVVEYNGMWMLNTLFTAMPEEWIIAQEMMFSDAETFLMFNQNMRNQSFDKMKTADVVIFNRSVRGKTDKEKFHKEVRIANRNNQILFEYGPEDVEADDIEDPLPYDIEAPEFEITDRDFAEWYRDIMENQDRYQDKIITVKGRIAMKDELPDGKFAFGRHLMTCCVEDIQFAGVACYADEELVADYNVGDWVTLRARVKVRFDSDYGEVGPTLDCMSISSAEPANPQVATF